MSKHPQNRFRRLVIVGPTDKQLGPPWSGPRRWAPQGPKAVRNNQESQATQAQFRSLRMAVMPTLSRGMWREALAWIWNFVRSYFAQPAERKRGAVVLSFRRSRESHNVTSTSLMRRLAASIRLNLPFIGDWLTT